MYYISRAINQRDEMGGGSLGAPMGPRSGDTLGLFSAPLSELLARFLQIKKSRHRFTSPHETRWF